ncbi:MAG: DUF58 domain-containing protein [Lachnospiraceae bacterium]|nr:DUF58 domain-containing protein [Lachnospiraceae bacterium]
MEKSNSLGFQSALIVNKGVIIGTFAFSLIAWWLGGDMIAALLLAVSVVGLVSRLWGIFALSKVKVTVRAESEVLSAGQQVKIEYMIENDKSLPLVWLEMCQDAAKNGCLEPDSSMTLRCFSPEEAHYSGWEKAYMRKFAFLMGHSEMEFECIWTGKRRGVYRPRNIILKSGDGFGLTQTVSETGGLAGTVFVVWPELKPVDTSVFLKNILNGNTGKSGWVEDPSVLRNEREYQEGDSWKRIDWRAAARTDELYTKQYEIIRPSSLLFVIDTSSFADKEEALSIAASVIWELSNKGITAGICLPATDEKESVLIRPDDPSGSLEDCMFELADHDADSAKADKFNLRELLLAAEGCGRVWVMSEDKEALLTGSLARVLSYSGAGYIYANADDQGISFSSIRAKEGSI